MSLLITIGLLGLLASVSPSTIVVFILLLATARARVNAAAFLIGWSVALLSTTTIGLIFLYFARRPGEAEAHLSDLRDRLVHAGPGIFAIVSVAVGIFLIIDGVTGIVGS